MWLWLQIAKRTAKSVVFCTSPINGAQSFWSTTIFHWSPQSKRLSLVNFTNHNGLTRTVFLSAPPHYSTMLVRDENGAMQKNKPIRILSFCTSWCTRRLNFIYCNSPLRAWLSSIYKPLTPYVYRELKLCRQITQCWSMLLMDFGIVEPYLSESVQDFFHQQKLILPKPGFPSHVGVTIMNEYENRLCT